MKRIPNEKEREDHFVLCQLVPKERLIEPFNCSVSGFWCNEKNWKHMQLASNLTPASDCNAFVKLHMRSQFLRVFREALTKYQMGFAAQCLEDPCAPLPVVNSDIRVAVVSATFWNRPKQFCIVMLPAPKHFHSNSVEKNGSAVAEFQKFSKAFLR